MTVKRRVQKLENEIGGISALHYLLVVGGGDETREQVLERKLKQTGLKLDEVGMVSYIGFGEGPDEEVYHPETPRKDLIGGDIWQEIIKAASDTLSLDPPSVTA